MSEKVKVIRSEPVEVSEPETTERNWTKYAAGAVIGAIGIVAAGAIYARFFGQDEDDFEDDTLWIPMPESVDNNA